MHFPSVPSVAVHTPSVSFFLYRPPWCVLLLSRFFCAFLSCRGCAKYSQYFSVQYILPVHTPLSLCASCACGILLRVLLLLRALESASTLDVKGTVPVDVITWHGSHGVNIANVSSSRFDLLASNLPYIASRVTYSTAGGGNSSPPLPSSTTRLPLLGYPFKVSLSPGASASPSRSDQGTQYHASRYSITKFGIRN